MTTTSDNSPTTVLPADDIPGPQQGHWTYEAYAAVPDDGKRYEIINGVLILHPARDIAHQSTVAHLAYYLVQAIDLAGLGEAFLGPLDVLLTPATVVQPDLLVVLKAHLQQIEEKYIIGAPDLAIEVTSLGTATYDRLNKYNAYKQAGVPEYWMVHPHKQAIEVFVLEEDSYQSLGVFRGKDTLPSCVVPGIADVAVEQFFV